MTSRDDDADRATDEEAELSPEEEQAVSALLAALPATPMPPEVIARIEAALAAEPALAATPGVTTLAKERDRRRPSRRPLVFRVAASVIALVGLTAFGIAVVNSGGATSSGGSSASTADAAAGAASVAASAAAPPASAPAGGVRLTASGQDYTAATLAVQAESLLTASAAPSASSAAGESTAPAASASGTSDNRAATLGKAAFASLQASPNKLAACVKELTDGDGRAPLAVDVGRWDHQVAFVIVLPADKTSTQRQVYVVKPTCGTTNEGTDILEVAFLDAS
jgi:hypothetical protein